MLANKISIYLSCRSQKPTSLKTTLWRGECRPSKPTSPAQVWVKTWTALSWGGSWYDEAGHR